MIGCAWAACLVGFLYLLLIIKMVQIWNNTPDLHIPNSYEPSLKLSIIIAARNEAHNVQALLKSLQNQNYPKALFEVILIDDYSKDQTVQKAKMLRWNQLRILKLADILAERPTNAFKKKAIETGIQHAQHPIILTTDADCIAPTNWLRTMTFSYESTSHKIITGPVAFHRPKNLLGQFQILEFAGTMLATLAGIKSKKMHSGNGANLMYSKAIFESVGGFDGNEHHASGDDLFLIHKIADLNPNSVGFVKHKEAQIFTEPKHTLQGFWRQRIRWGTKSSSYKDYSLLALFALVFLNALLVVLSGFWAFFNPSFHYFSLVIFAFKFLADYRLLSTATKALGLSQSMRYFLPSFFLYLAYIIAVGLGSLFLKNYEWKGRSVH